MLTLARKKDESIIIGQDIEITVLEIKGDVVRIGIEAPKSIPIYRKELFVQIQESNKEAIIDNISLESIKNILK